MARIRWILALVGAAVFFCAMLCGASWLFRPDLANGGIARTPEEIAAAEAARRMNISADSPPTIWRDVEYAEADAPWRPKMESPILAELVEEGRLPSVAERVGKEPLVLEGVDGAGRYGGSWMRIANVDSDISQINNRLSYCTLLRYSPQGYPIVPHVAKSYSVSPDNREFVFTLREGMRWSDGAPYTADDVMYWWEHECNDPLISATPPPYMLSRGKPATVEKLGPYKVKFTFPSPFGMFPAHMASSEGSGPANSPAHYLRQYHPNIGDPKIIAEYQQARRLPSPLAVYRDVKSYLNPEHPRLWPWVYKTYKPNPPQSFVRNPYYWVVDPNGSQLPYIDRVIFEVKSQDMLGISAANGDVSMQARHIRYDQYTLLMDQRDKYDFDVYHWYPGDRGVFVIGANLNRRIEPDKPETAFKHQLLNDKRFRQALSSAINRKAIIDAEYNGQTEPAQVSPGPESFFYEPSLFHAFTEYDPGLANRLLDEIGLTKRDFEGFRTFPDGSRMTFFFNYCSFTGVGPGQFIVDDWAKVGVRCILRERSRALFYGEKGALVQDFSVWIGNGEHLPLLQPRYFAPIHTESNWALGFVRWYARGGLYGNPQADREHGCIEPPPGHPLRRALEIYENAIAESDPVWQREIFRAALEIAAENIWTISVSTPPPVLAVVKRDMRNVPRDLVYCWDFQSPGNAGIETFYFENPADSPGAIAQIKSEIIQATPPPDAPSAARSAAAMEGLRAANRSAMENAFASAGRWISWLLYLAIFAIPVWIRIRRPHIGRGLIWLIAAALLGLIGVNALLWRMEGGAAPTASEALSLLLRLGFASIAIALALMIAFRHPYIGKRLLIMVPTLLIISAIAFTVIQLPPGDYVATRIMQLRESGDEADLQVIDDLKRIFYLEEPMVKRYLRWMGVFWFSSLKEEDKGLLQGAMGRSMESMRPVNEIVGDRIMLTFFISLGTILFTWALAIPIGIYSAVRQYSIGDYILTFIGFIGMCVPNFLLALLLMYASAEWFGVPVSGLFSSQYGAQPEWTWGKVQDLLRHIWVPILVLGTGGTASMIRVMRANLLDELRKPYVVTARAKGVRPLKLLFKYPVRIALNPFISGIGSLFPQLVSGGAIVAMVLSLPTVGPLMLSALMSEDMYLAGSMLMVLSTLGVLGTLVSDLLLLWLDPRIRFQGGTR